jgi:hypothetical protein
VNVYLDTSALVRRAEAAVATPDARNAHAGPPVAALLASPPQAVATAEVGLLELHDVLTKFWRDTDPATNQYDEHWIRAAIALVMEDIESGRLIIQQSPVRAFEHAMSLVTMAALPASGQRKFRIWDAVHLVTATGWAVGMGEPIELWTSDTDFESFLQLFPSFTAWISVRNLDN